MAYALSMSESRFDLRPVAEPLSAAERQERMKELGFGKIFTEHMVTIEYREASGWGRGALLPYRPIEIDPAASVLHYGQAIFEGFKAYRQADGGIATFRPDANARRFASSARRLAMPELPEDLFIEAADILIRQERGWVPPEVGQSLYLRPLMVATEAALGVRPAKQYLYILFGSPSGAYFPKGIKPVTVWISIDYARAAPGGTGDAKCAGNYAASLVAHKQALSEGCDQVVWLDSTERKYIEEMGGMNLFFVYTKGAKTKLFTPKLTGTLLPGVTRDSILTIAQDMGYEVEEGSLSVDQWKKDIESGAMTEVFACGTAAVITPVGQVKSKLGDWEIHGGETGPVASKLRETLLDMQHGRRPAPEGWIHRVC